LVISGMGEESDRLGAGRLPRQDPALLPDRLWTHQPEVLAFLDGFAVSFDNNRAERDLGVIKVQSKISGTFRSLMGARVFFRLRSVLSTWRQPGRSTLDALEIVFAGHSLTLQLGPE
jgi:transposase